MSPAGSLEEDYDVNLSLAEASHMRGNRFRGDYRGDLFPVGVTTSNALARELTNSIRLFRTTPKRAEVVRQYSNMLANCAQAAFYPVYWKSRHLQEDAEDVYQTAAQLGFEFGDGRISLSFKGKPITLEKNGSCIMANTIFGTFSLTNDPAKIPLACKQLIERLSR